VQVREGTVCLSQMLSSLPAKIGQEAVTNALDAQVPHSGVQGYLAHEKQPYPSGPPLGPRHDSTVGS